MKSMRLVAAIVTSVFCVSSALAQPIRKKQPIVVTVTLTSNCLQGISLTGDILGDREFCADEPQGVGNYFQRFVGSDIEVEARWTFDGNLRTDAPTGLGKVFKIGREKVSSSGALGNGVRGTSSSGHEGQ
jgi:hypothetical protein